ncbi:hypothetical protein CK203_098198 [Vitis vinifera]|uniref:Protein FAM33A n=1 Tax=Vitis vinifera TaxID=29760 RepID=A0A438CJK2_VITVI|nr:hypothetical protein CK203_098198 [Vitis vinifera]
MKNQQHHEAMDGLLNLFTKANHDLTLVQHRLEKEFQQIYPHNANPMILVSRIKKLQEDLFSLKEQCQELLAANRHWQFDLFEDLIDKARTTLVGNRSLLQRMQAPMGIPLPVILMILHMPTLTRSLMSGPIKSDQEQVRLSGPCWGCDHESESEDINKMLFSAIVQSN